MKITFTLLIAILVSFESCVSPDAGRLAILEKKQDSLFVMLKRIEQQTTFMAKKLGWEPPEDTLPKNIPLSHSFYQGAENPILTVVEFSDFQCPYCARLAPVLDSLAKSYPEKVRVVFKHFPLSFHKQAMSAHAASLAAGKQGRFYDYRYAIAPKYRELNDSTYLKVAEELGLDMEAFKTEMAMTADMKKIIDEDIHLGQEIGVRGTPTIFVNGKKPKDRSYAGFVRLLKSLE